jgi:prolyl-tRNA editing enzyme YbaK/EbsC (Cys-tRNA(Pro) deacylase)
VSGPTAEDVAADPGKAVVEALDGLGVAYEVMECDPDFADTAAFCERYGVAPEQSANTIIVASKRGEKKYAACVVAATARLDVNRKVRELMGVKKVSFASAEVTAELTGMLIGGVTVFALPPELPIYIDEPLMAEPEIVLGGGSRSQKIRIAPSALDGVANLTVITGLGIVRPSE